MNVWLLSVSVSISMTHDMQWLIVLFTDTGAQPLVSDDGQIILAVNGEIYNHIKLRAGLKNPYKFKTHSDCEVIIPLEG